MTQPVCTIIRVAHGGHNIPVKDIEWRFEQHGDERNIIEPTYYQLLLEEAGL